MAETAVKRFIRDAEGTGNVDIAKLLEVLQLIPDAESLLPIFEWLKTDQADYAETIREISQLRRERREFLQRNGHEIPAGQLLELPDGLPQAGGVALTSVRIAA